MRWICGFAIVYALMTLPGNVVAQGNKKKEADFVKTHPKAGDALPNVMVANPDGKPFNTADLRGHYTVLTFGCLT